jgi:hypothetical protein
LQELFVDDVCDGGDEGFDVFGVVDEGVNVALFHLLARL